jgi:hypothetical protein
MIPSFNDHANGRKRRDRGGAMNLESDRQLLYTRRKLELIEGQIALAKARVDTSENRESVASLVQMANQLREEIARYQAKQKRRAS